MDDSFEFPSKKGKNEAGELEVTGVSRSGRVRKKSSKLTDFESLDDLEQKAKLKKEKESPTSSRPMKKDKFVKQEEYTDEDVARQLYLMKQPESEESDVEMPFQQNDDSSLSSLESDVGDLDEGDLEVDEETQGFQQIVSDSPEESPVQPMFVADKGNKKKLVIKDGKIMAKKSPKKDKGKSRCTPYMLWAKEIRQELMRSNPELDFSQTSKKLGELWATVPFHEKYIWKRRAKRMAEKAAIKPQPVMQSTIEPKKAKASPNRKFGAKQTPSQNLASNSSPTEKIAKTALVETSVFKPVGTTPLDVAAHLRLLGESLTIIGERLTEHEGQITVSGSFSVLLDSLLCALGPLLCLTQQVPQLNVIPQDQLSQLMDTIAYIMPGL